MEKQTTPTEGLERNSTQKNILQKLGLGNFIGQDPVFLEMLDRIRLLADSNATILISGETGVGKEIAARAIHYLSDSSHKPFVPINCGAMPASLMENELFGHKRGAFTDAHTDRPGLIAEAGRGTLFLDEIEALSLEGQSKLLRLLQEKSYRLLGDTKQVSTDSRFIAATNVALKDKMKEGLFRSDLFYRLTITVNVPPLRKRKSDIPLLVNYFLKKYASNYGKYTAPAPAAMQKLINYNWPGNIRELENILLEAFLLSQRTIISPENINIPMVFEHERLESLPIKEAKRKVVEQFERGYVINQLIQHKGNISHAAKEAQKDRSDFGKLIKKYGIDTRDYKNKNI